MKEIENPKELEEVLKSPDKTVVYYFWSMCPHCQRMHKPYEQLEADHTDTKFVKVETKNIPKKLKKTAFPEFELREGGQVKQTVGGEMSKEELGSKLFGSKLGGRRRRARTRRLRRRTRKTLH